MPAARLCDRSAAMQRPAPGGAADRVQRGPCSCTVFLSEASEELDSSPAAGIIYGDLFIASATLACAADCMGGPSPAMAGTAVITGRQLESMRAAVRPRA